MAYTDIDLDLIRSGKAVLYTLFGLLRTNFDDQESRISTLESGAGAVPVGIVSYFGGTSAPMGYLACAGSVVSQATYAALYAVCGSAFDTGGEGSGNFRLPDLRGRTPIGVGAGATLTSRALGDKIGEETHVLTTSEIPTHTHTITDAGHTHTWPDVAGGGTPGIIQQSGMLTFTAFSTQSKVTGITIADTGSGTAHENMQPTTVVEFIIKA